MRLEIKKHKENYEVNVFEKESHVYGNVFTRDPNRIAQILIDLEFQGFPIKEAIKIMQKRFEEKDWLGF